MASAAAILLERIGAHGLDDILVLVAVYSLDKLRGNLRVSSRAELQPSDRKSVV